MRIGDLFSRWNGSTVAYEDWVPDDYKAYFARRTFRIVRQAALIRQLGRFVQRRFTRAPLRKETSDRRMWSYCWETVPIKNIAGVRTTDGRFRPRIATLGGAARETWVRLYATDREYLPTVTMEKRDGEYYLHEDTLALLTIELLRIRGVREIRARVGTQVEECTASNEDAYISCRSCGNEPSRTDVVADVFSVRR